ncbi:MAG: trehalose-phosphatase [Candidatus Korobacteraceae bacterium]
MTSPIPAIPLPISKFMEELARIGQGVLFLDYDGTLAPFTPDREHAYPYPDAIRLLKAIRANGRTRLVLVSGRPAKDVQRLLGLEPAPEIWGVHGLERLLPSGEYRRQLLSTRQTEGLIEARSWIESQGLQAHMEVKPGSLAFHWRGLREDAIEELRARIELLWQPFTRGNDLCLKAFDGGIELRVCATDKGDAVRRVISETSGSVPMAYLGDDWTDEDGFRALAGCGLTILVRSEHRPTLATAWLTPPEQLVDFLAEWLRACGGNDE